MMWMLQTDGIQQTYLLEFTRPNKPFSKGVAYRMKADSEAKLTKETGFHPRVSNLTENIIEYKGFWLASKL